MGNRGSSNNENQTNLDHLTTNPQYQNTLRNIYSNNSSVPAFPGAALSYQEVILQRTTPIKMKKATPLKCNFLFERSSVEFIPTHNPNQYSLTFQFSCEAEIQVTIYFCGKDVVDDNQNTQDIVINTEKYPSSQSFVFPAGKNQKFPINSLNLDLGLYAKDDLTNVVDDEVYPLIVKLETIAENSETSNTKLFNYFILKINDATQKVEAKFLKQKFEYKNRSYVLDDIYGTTNLDRGEETNQDKDCSICLSNKLNTVVLPCKHICLCVDCAKNLRAKNNQKCPLCRKYVETFLILKRSRKAQKE